MTYEEIKDKLPSNYVHKPDTIILVNDKGEPVLQDNMDGTVSGFAVKSIFGEKPTIVK